MGVLRGEFHWQDFWWWAAWVLVCAFAGALAGFGLVEFYWEYPGGYDGGFMGDLVFFGGFLALGQAPFIAVFVCFLSRQAGNLRWQRYSMAARLTILWSLVGFVGWTLGSYIEVALSTAIPLYSVLYILARSVRWLVFGIVEGIFLSLAIIPALYRWWHAGLYALVWIIASTVGGLLYEAWSATEIAARSNDFNEAIGGFLQSIGVAENVAYVMVPHALFVPLLYGIPTGFVFVVVLYNARWAQSGLR